MDSTTPFLTALAAIERGIDAVEEDSIGYDVGGDGLESESKGIGGNGEKSTVGDREYGYLAPSSSDYGNDRSEERAARALEALRAKDEEIGRLREELERVRVQSSELGGLHAAWEKASLASQAVEGLKLEGVEESRLLGALRKCVSAESAVAAAAVSALGEGGSFDLKEAFASARREMSRLRLELEEKEVHELEEQEKRKRMVEEDGGRSRVVMVERGGVDVEVVRRLAEQLGEMKSHTATELVILRDRLFRSECVCADRAREIARLKHALQRERAKVGRSKGMGVEERFERDREVARLRSTVGRLQRHVAMLERSGQIWSSVVDGVVANADGHDREREKMRVMEAADVVKTIASRLQEPREKAALAALVGSIEGRSNVEDAMTFVGGKTTSSKKMIHLVDAGANYSSSSSSSSSKPVSSEVARTQLVRACAVWRQMHAGAASHAVSAVAQRLGIVERALDVATADRERAENRANAAEQTVSAAKAVAAHAKSMLRAAHERARQLEKRLADASEAHEHTVASMETRLRLAQAAKKALADSSSMQNLAKENARLAGKADDALRQAHAAQTQLRISQQANEDLRNAVADAETLAFNAVAAATAAKAERDDLKRLLQEAQTRIRQTRNQMREQVEESVVRGRGVVSSGGEEVEEGGGWMRGGGDSKGKDCRECRRELAMVTAELQMASAQVLAGRASAEVEEEEKEGEEGVVRAGALEGQAVLDLLEERDAEVAELFGRAARAERRCVAWRARAKVANEWAHKERWQRQRSEAVAADAAAIADANLVEARGRAEREAVRAAEERVLEAVNRALAHVGTNTTEFETSTRALLRSLALESLRAQADAAEAAARADAAERKLLIERVSRRSGRLETNESDSKSDHDDDTEDDHHHKKSSRPQPQNDDDEVDLDSSDITIDDEAVVRTTEQLESIRAQLVRSRHVAEQERSARVRAEAELGKLRAWAELATERESARAAALIAELRDATPRELEEELAFEVDAEDDKRDDDNNDAGDDDDDNDDDDDGGKGAKKSAAASEKVANAKKDNDVDDDDEKKKKKEEKKDDFEGGTSSEPVAASAPRRKPGDDDDDVSPSRSDRLVWTLSRRVGELESALEESRSALESERRARNKVEEELGREVGRLLASSPSGAFVGRALSRAVGVMAEGEARAVRSAAKSERTERELWAKVARLRGKSGEDLEGVLDEVGASLREVGRVKRKVPVAFRDTIESWRRVLGKCVAYVEHARSQTAAVRSTGAAMAAARRAHTLAIHRMLQDSPEASFLAAAIDAAAAAVRAARQGDGAAMDAALQTLANPPEELRPALESDVCAHGMQVAAGIVQDVRGLVQEAQAQLHRLIQSTTANDEEEDEDTPHEKYIGSGPTAEKGVQISEPGRETPLVAEARRGLEILAQLVRDAKDSQAQVSLQALRRVIGSPGLPSPQGTDADSSEVVALRATVRSLRGSLARALRELEDRRELERLSSLLEHQERQDSVTEEELETLRVQVREREAAQERKDEELRNEIAALRSQLEAKAAESESAERSSEVDRLQRQLAALEEDDRSRLVHQVHTLTEQLEKLESENSALRHRIQSHPHPHPHPPPQNIPSSTSSSSEEKEALQAHLLERQRELVRYVDRVRRLETELDALRSKSDETETLRRKMAEQEERHSAIKGELRSALAALRTASEAQASAEETAAKDRVRAEEWEREATRLSRRGEETRQQLEAERRSRDALEEEKVRWERDLVEWKRKETEWEREHSRIEREAGIRDRRAQEAVQEANRRVGEVERTMEATLQAKTEVEAKLEKEEQTTKDLELKVKELERIANPQALRQESESWAGVVRVYALTLERYHASVGHMLAQAARVEDDAVSPGRARSPLRARRTANSKAKSKVRARRRTDDTAATAVAAGGGAGPEHESAKQRASSPSRPWAAGLRRHPRLNMSRARSAPPLKHHRRSRRQHKSESPPHIRIDCNAPSWVASLLRGIAEREAVLAELRNQLRRLQSDGNETDAPRDADDDTSTALGRVVTGRSALRRELVRSRPFPPPPLDALRLPPVEGPMSAAGAAAATAAATAAAAAARAADVSAARAGFQAAAEAERDALRAELEESRRKEAAARTEATAATKRAIEAERRRAASEAEKNVLSESVAHHEAELRRETEAATAADQARRQAEAAVQETRRSRDLLRKKLASVQAELNQRIARDRRAARLRLGTQHVSDRSHPEKDGFLGTSHPEKDGDFLERSHPEKDGDILERSHAEKDTSGLDLSRRSRKDESFSSAQQRSAKQISTLKRQIATMRTQIERAEKRAEDAEKVAAAARRAQTREAARVAGRSKQLESAEEAERIALDAAADGRRAAEEYQDRLERIEAETDRDVRAARTLVEAVVRSNHGRADSVTGLAQTLARATGSEVAAPSADVYRERAELILATVRIPAPSRTDVAKAISMCVSDAAKLATVAEALRTRVQVATSAERSDASHFISSQDLAHDDSDREETTTTVSSTDSALHNAAASLAAYERALTAVQRTVQQHEQ